MVSKASEDLPDPLRPVITVNALRGMSTLMFLRLCWRAPRTEIFVIAIGQEHCPSVTWTGPQKCWKVRVRNSTHVSYLPIADSVNAGRLRMRASGGRTGQRTGRGSGTL